MKRFLILVLTTYSMLASAQKHDYVWVMGYSSNGNPNSNFGGTIIDFNESPLTPKYRHRDINISFNATTICDSSGMLQFYTNGCKVVGADDVVIENGVDINKEDVVFHQCHLGMPGTQGTLILPQPGNPGIYFLFQKISIITRTPTVGSAYIKLLYTKVDTHANGGKDGCWKKISRSS